MENRVFRQFDRDRSGTIEPQELSNALSTFGYNLSTQLIQMLQSKYSESRFLYTSGGSIFSSLTAKDFVRTPLMRTLSSSFQILQLKFRNLRRVTAG